MDELIAEAVRNLSEQQRNIILPAYFLEMSDPKIGKKLNMMRTTVRYQRTIALKQLRKFIDEEVGDDEKQSKQTK